MRKANSTSFKKGNKGKPVGAVNHLTKTVKETVLSVFNEIQSDPRIKLQAFAKRYPRDFYNIAARLIPTELQTHFGKVKIEIVRRNNDTGNTGSTTPGSAESDKSGTSL
jgi:hypothetical protein